MSNLNEIKAYSDQIREKFKGKRWFQGVGLFKASDDEWGIKILVTHYPFFCRVPGDGSIKITIEKTGRVKAQEKGTAK